MAIFNNQLGEGDLDEVSGGVIFNSSGLTTDDNDNKKTPWEVLDNNGNVMVVDGKELRFDSLGAAAAAANANNVSDQQVTWDWVKGRRGIF